MQKLKIRAVKIFLNTDKGIFGQCVKFETGLNIIRAENTSGKSTLINSIIYTLGFEKLLSQKTGYAALKPVLKSKGDFNDEEFNVIESYTSIEIENNQGEVITVKRQIIGEVNSNLVTVYYGSMIISKETNLKSESYYLNAGGSAQREKGFHKFLELFLNLTLPFVSRYNGSDVPLYLECIIPLMFIEQIRGWSQIQATTPRNYSIQNIENVSIEYLLSLDVQKIKKEREEIETELNLLRQLWTVIKNEMQEIANRIGGKINNFPNQITTNLEQNEYPTLFIISDDKLFTIDNYLSTLRLQLGNLNIETSENKKDNSSDLELKLEDYENRLLMLNTRLKGLNSEYNLEKESLKFSKDRFENIENDIKKHIDIKRIIKLGAEEDISITKGICPTCKQSINDVLLENFSEPMSIDENISFLHSQKDALKFIITTNEKKLEVLLTKRTQLQNEIKKLREIILSIKNDLVSNQNVSEHKIREKIYLEQRIQNIEKERDAFDEKLNSLLKLIADISENRKRKASLSKDYFSENDRQKLGYFSEEFSELLSKYGYRSTLVGRIIISEENYRPVCSEEGFEIALDSSASDNIRIIWAFTVAMLKLSLKYITNHWGIIILDEPEQQRMKEASSAELYKSFAFENLDEYQSIIATSENRINLSTKLNNIKCNLMDFEEKVIRPEKEWLYII